MQAAERETASIEKLDRQITAIAYDSELHLRLSQLEQPALQRKKMHDQVGEQANKREVERGHFLTRKRKHKPLMNFSIRLRRAQSRRPIAQVNE